MKNIAIIIRGPAGAGKSTIAERLKKQISNSIHLDIDMLKWIISPESSSIRTKIAHNVGRSFINQLTKAKFNLIIEEIFRENYYLAIKKILKKNNYKIISIFLSAPVSTLKNRNKHRKTKTKDVKVIEKLSEEIKPFPTELVVDSSKKSKDEIVKIILKEVSKIC